MDERDQDPRYPVSVPVMGSVVDNGGLRRGLSANTLNVSYRGVAIAIQGRKSTIVKLPSLLPEAQVVDLEIEPSPAEPRIKAKGKVRWHETRSLGRGRHYFVAGIALDVIEREDLESWRRFVKHVGVATRSGDEGM